MKKMNPFVAFVAGIMVASIMFAGIAGLVRGQDSPTPTTLTYVEHAVTDTAVDISGDGDSAGDVLTFANQVFDADNASQVGMDNGYCVRTVAGSTWECVWTIQLESGQITVEGPFYDAADSVLAITGGTGVFMNATGQMMLHARNAEGSEYDFTYMVNGLSGGG